jgi:peptidyl-prolyl cis-trans isomerase C
MERTRAFLLQILKEPLVHFFAIGFLLFVAGQWYRTETDVHRIVVTPDRVAKIALDYQLQFGTFPTRTELDRLVNTYVDDEVLFREGLALKLDRGDEIVRRRVVQKMQFIEQGANPPAEPTGQQLADYYRAHAGRYTTPARVSFTHIYFSPDRAGADAARRRATAVLSVLGNSARAPERGDAFSDLYDYANYGSDQMTRLFGHSEFAGAVFTASVGRWSGPYRSGYGFHLVLVESRVPPVLPPLSTISETVRNDYLADEQERENLRAFEALKKRYRIERSYTLR